MMLNCKGYIDKKAKYISEYKFEYDRINRLSNRACKSRPVHQLLLKVFGIFLERRCYLLPNFLFKKLKLSQGCQQFCQDEYVT